MWELKPKGFSQEELSQLGTGVPLKEACALDVPPWMVPSASLDS